MLPGKNEQADLVKANRRGCRDRGEILDLRRRIRESTSAREFSSTEFPSRRDEPQILPLLAPLLSPQPLEHASHGTNGLRDGRLSRTTGEDRTLRYTNQKFMELSVHCCGGRDVELGSGFGKERRYGEGRSGGEDRRRWSLKRVEGGVGATTMRVQTGRRRPGPCEHRIRN